MVRHLYQHVHRPGDKKKATKRKSLQSFIIFIVIIPFHGKNLRFTVGLLQNIPVR